MACKTLLRRKRVARANQTGTPMNASTMKTSPSEAATNGLTNLRNSDEMSRAAHLQMLTTPAIFGPRCAPTSQPPHNQIVVAILEDAAVVILRNGMRQTVEQHANPHIKTTLRQVG